MSPLIAKILGKDSNSTLESIRLHLEHLINTRRTTATWPAYYNQLNESLLSFGVLPINNLIQWCENLRKTIQDHEHRLTDVVVSFEHSTAQTITPLLIIYAALESHCAQALAFGVDLHATHASVCISSLKS